MSKQAAEGDAFPHERVDPSAAPMLTFTSHGARLGIRVSEPELLDRVRRILPVGSQVETTTNLDVEFSLHRGKPCELYQGSKRLIKAPTLRPLLELLQSKLHFEVARSARTALFVHAGVVTWRERALLLPGRSMSGKTTLVAALVRAGATYYSDEYAVIDSAGLIHPYARRLALRDGKGPRRRVSVEAIGGSAGDRPLAATLVVATHYTPGATFDPIPLSEAQALLCLIDNTVVARERPKLAMDTLARVARSATALRGDRGEADEVAPILLDALGQSADRVDPLAVAR